MARAPDFGVSAFPPERKTEVDVPFEPVDGGIRVVVEHRGQDGIP